MGDGCVEKGKIENLIAKLADLEKDLEDLDEVKRENAMQQMRQLKNDISSVLLLALRSGDPSSRRGAAYGLGKLRDTGALELLIHASLNDCDESVRCWSVEALGIIGDPMAIPPLVEILGDPNPYIVYCASVALKRLPEDEVIKVLVEAYQTSEPNLRRRIIKMLGEMKAISAISYIIQGLNDADKRVRYEAVEALHRIGDRSAAYEVIKTLHDESRDVRFAAIQTLRDLGDDQAVEPLIRVCVENEDLRSSALQALEAICGKESIKPVIDILDQLSSMVRGAAGRVLSQSSFSSAV